MQYARYRPRTIINVGVGRGHELGVWKHFFPKARTIGFDPKPRPHWWKGEEYHQVALGKETDWGVFCDRCSSLKCQDDGHAKVVVSIDKLDGMAHTLSAKGPHFLWMDCEGAEIDVLEGATKVLKKTSWLSTECRNFEWDARHESKMNTWLNQHGYHPIYFIGDDVLFTNQEFKIV